jgi:hypothetical protein
MYFRGRCLAAWSLCCALVVIGCGDDANGEPGPDGSSSSGASGAGGGSQHPDDAAGTGGASGRDASVVDASASKDASANDEDDSANDEDDSANDQDDSANDQDAAAEDSGIDSGVSDDGAPDRDCVVSKLLEARYLGIPRSSGTLYGSGTVVAALNDCEGRPFTDLTADDFMLIEDGAAVAASPIVMPRSALRVFLKLVLQLGTETVTQQAALLAAAKGFVDDVVDAVDVPVLIALEGFDGQIYHQRVNTWPLPYTSDVALVKQRIDAESTQLLIEPGSSALFGALLTGAHDVAAADTKFAEWARGGSFNTTFLVVAASGADDKGDATLMETLAELDQSPDRLLAVGLDTARDDADALQMIARDGFFSAHDEGSIAAAFDALAARAIAQIQGTYVLAYCTDKLGGTYSVGVSLHDAVQRVSGSASFSNLNVTSTCSTAALEDVCDGIGCGGDGCGTCGDFATQRCGNVEEDQNPYFPLPPYTGEGWECEDGPPETHPVPGEVIETCYSACTIPNHCCRDYDSSLWICLGSSTSCGDFGSNRVCDDSGDCTPGSYCCFNGCALACDLEGTACVEDQDCAMWSADCGPNGRCVASIADAGVDAGPDAGP